MFGDKRENRILSFILAFGLALSIAAVAPLTANAYSTGNDYKYKDGPINGSDGWNFYTKQCTSFVAWCLRSRNGIDFTNQYGGVSIWGHARDWPAVARGLGYTVDNNPAVGSVAYDTKISTYGHVAWVSAVNGNNVTVEEYNFKNPYAFGSRSVDKGQFEGYIHIADIDVVADGRYKIQHKGSGKYVDVAGGSKDNSGNVHLWENADVLNQQWDFKRLSDGSYKITAAHSGKALDVGGGGKDDRVNIQQYDWNDTASQHWSVVDCGGGYYKLIAKVSGKALDVDGGGKDNGTNIRQYADNGTDAQRFKLVPVSAKATPAPSTPATPPATPAPSTPATPPAPSAPDHVKLSGEYKIVNVASGKYLNNFGRNNNGAKVTASNGDGSIEQKWAIGAYDGNKLLIRSLYGSQTHVLDIACASASDLNDGDITHMWSQTPFDSKHWYFEPLGNDTYVIRSALNEKLALAVRTNEHRSDVIVQTYSGSDAQKWKLVK